MRRATILAALGLACLAVGLGWQPGTIQAQRGAGLQWIWFNEGDPAKNAPAETRYFRKTFMMKQPFVDEAALDITADNEFTVWVNGVEVGKGNEWKRVYRFDVKKHIVNGTNVVAVKAHNTEGSAGLLVKLSYVPNGTSKVALVSDATWKASKTAGDGWQKGEFDDSVWIAAKALGAYGKVGPWKGLAWDAGGDDRFIVPSGFRVEMVVPANVKVPGLDAKQNFSLVNMTFDNKGRLLISQERGPILLCTEPNKDGVFQSIKPYCTQITNCQGMCWVKDALLLVGNGPNRTGLYRVRDTKGKDQTDEVTLLHSCRGGMGEHGPHAIIHGPDNWLYLVIGNHAGAQPDKLAANSPLTRWPTGGHGPDQGKPGTTEDVLLPRFNDARGHAANILAPGGTIWRLDHEGKNMSLVTAGFRNEFDAAFSPTGDLFTFDSDMEWDEALPWYRPVRVCFCPPGAELGWRTGSSKIPPYALDTLPAIYDTGRGSPVGVEFYDHHAYPEKYRGCCFMADWSLGIIYAVHPKRAGAGYTAEVERFCQGAPMNVTDCAVAPDGALYFTMGGRNTQGGVYRIVCTEGGGKKPAAPAKPDRRSLVASQEQPLSAWGRENFQAVKKADRGSLCGDLADLALDKEAPTPLRLRALMLVHNHFNADEHNQIYFPARLAGLSRDRDPSVRAQAIYLLGVLENKSHKADLIKALKDEDAFVRRRACEALIRAGIEPPVEAVWPLLGDKDRFLRTAARLVLQRIEPKKWTPRLWKEPSDETAFDGIIALCKTGQAAPVAGPIFERLHNAPKGSVDTLLNYLRTVQLALVHTSERPATVKAIAQQCDQLFPHSDWRVNRELAILLTHFRRDGQLDKPVQGKLLAALLASKDDRLQQIHYFYCFRFLKDPWTPEQRGALTAWYDATQTWTGGASFTPFLENIFREALNSYTLADRREILAAGEKTPLASLVLAQKLQTDRQPELLAALSALSARLAKMDGKLHRMNELRQAVMDALVRTALEQPTAENWPYLVLGLQSTNPLVLFDVIEGLKKHPTKPKAEDPTPYRALLLASGRIKDEKSRWKVVELLRHWSNGRQFGEETGQWKEGLRSWTKWFAQAFPKEPPLPDLVADKPVESKYKFDELLAFLEKDPAGRKGDVVRGRQVFEKAQCLKCHKYGKEGEGVGPDLSTLSKRFKRVDTLESIIYPSKVISDQYRSVTIVTTKGQQLHGLAAVQGDSVTVLQSDGSKVTLTKREIEQQFASLVSVMPEKLLDPLNKQEIADLFAFLESEPAK